MDPLDPDNPGLGAQAQDYTPPTQIFSNLAANDSLSSPALPPDFFPDASAGFSLSNGLLDDDPNDHEAKRRRVRASKACDDCRRKKIRCDMKAPKCTNCDNYKTDCIFTHVEKKRNPPKGAKYIEGLENRLERMEHLLKMSGLLSDDDPGATDLAALERRLAHQNSSPSSFSNSRPGTEKFTPDSPASQRESNEREKKDSRAGDVDELSDLLCSVMVNDHGETRFLGSSSGFSIFSPRGIQWVNEKTGDASFLSMVMNTAATHNKWFDWKPQVFDDVFSRRVYQPLPSKEECFFMIEDFFGSFNKMFPLYHEPTFRFLLEKQYSDDPYEGSGWWASLNIALALAYRIRVVKTMGRADNGDSKAWAYFKNAVAMHPELTLKNSDLLSVAALLAMALFMQGTPNPQPSFALAGAAIRLAHSIGLHRRVTGFGLNPSEVEQRRRVYWIAYLIDKDMSLRSGRPSLQNEDDFTVELPSQFPEDGVGVVETPDGKTFNLFRKFAEFSIIAGKVYSELYSNKASRQSDGELLGTIGNLDQELQDWKDSIPLEFRPEHEPQIPNKPLMLQLICLHFGYYNCVSTIHRRSVHNGYWTNRLSDHVIRGLNVHPLSNRVYSSALLCVQAARASINLLKFLPSGDYAMIWVILYYPVSSLVTLFANVLQNPQDGRAKADISLMRVVVNFLSNICTQETSGSIQRMHIVCSELEKIAVRVMERATKNMPARQKRKQDKEDDKIEKDPSIPDFHEPRAAGKSSSEIKKDTPSNSQTPAESDSDQRIRTGLTPGLDPVIPPDQSVDPVFRDAFTAMNEGFPWSMNCFGSGADFASGPSQATDTAFPVFGLNDNVQEERPIKTAQFQQPLGNPDFWSGSNDFGWNIQDFVNATPFNENGPGAPSSDV